jgi:hypothetical protein
MGRVVLLHWRSRGHTDGVSSTWRINRGQHARFSDDHGGVKKKKIKLNDKEIKCIFF